MQFSDAHFSPQHAQVTTIFTLCWCPNVARVFHIPSYFPGGHTPMQGVAYAYSHIILKKDFFLISNNSYLKFYTIAFI